MRCSQLSVCKHTKVREVFLECASVAQSLKHLVIFLFLFFCCFWTQVCQLQVPGICSRNSPDLPVVFQRIRTLPGAVEGFPGVKLLLENIRIHKTRSTQAKVWFGRFSSGRCCISFAPEFEMSGSIVFRFRRPYSSRLPNKSQIWKVFLEGAFLTPESEQLSNFCWVSRPSAFRCQERRKQFAQ